MKVLIIGRGLPYAECPLHGIFEFDQAKALYTAGYDVILFAIDLRSLRWKRRYGISHEVRKGIQCYTISIPVGAVPARLFCKIGQFALAYLYRYVFKKQNKPDIIHAHFPEQSYMAVKLSKRINVPVVITEHFSKINNKNIKEDLLFIAKYAYQNADRVIAVGGMLATSIYEIAGVNCDIIPNIVDTRLFHPSNSINENRTCLPVKFISVGRLIKLKRMDLLVEAFKALVERYPDSILEIYGDGPEKQKLINLIENLKLENNVFIKGVVQRDKLAEVMPNMDCFVLLSQSETFGVAYIEALASGIPVIATKCGGPDEFMNEKLGLSIECDNKEAAIDALCQMHDHCREYEKEQLRSIIEKSFAEKVVASKLISIYDDVISEKMIFKRYSE